MANKFVVQYVIKARDAFTKNAKKASKAMGKLSINAKTAARNIKLLGKRLVGAGKNAKESKKLFAESVGTMKKVAVGVAVAIGSVVTVGAKFQTAMADMSSITGATGEQLKFYQDETMRLGKVSIKSAAEVATAFKLVASAKSDLLKDPKALSNVTEQVLLLANASGIELSSAAMIVTQSLNQYGASAQDAARYVNILAAGSKIGASEVNETGVAISKAGSVAKLSGLSFETLNSAIQVLAKNGQKAEIAGTGLKTMLLKLESQGVSNIKPSVVGLEQALANLGKMNLSVTQKSKLFGTEAVTIGSILIENAGLVKKWTKELTGTQIAAEQAKTRMATFAKQSEKMGIVIKNSLIRVFLKIEPILTKVVQDMGAFFDSFSDEDLQAVSSSILGVVETAKFFLNVLVKIKKIVAAIADSFGFTGLISGAAQMVGAITTGDFSQFSDEGGIDKRSAETIKSQKRRGGNRQIDLQVGLDKGLTQTQPAKVGSGGRNRRFNTGNGSAVALGAL